MQTSESWLNGDVALRQAPCPAAGSLFVKTQMRPVVVIIVEVSGKKALQVPFVQSDDVLQQIASAASHPALGDSILPRAPE
jgi:hypothetical protein